MTDEWVEVFQPDGAPAPPTPEATVTAARYGVVTAVLFVAALLLVIVGSVTPLFNASIPLYGGAAGANGPADLLSADAWHLTTAANGVDQAGASRSITMPVPLGYPLALAGLLLLVTVALWLRAGQRPAAARAAKPVGLAASVFLAGLVIALGMFELAWDRLGSSSLFAGLGTGVGTGYWTLLAGAAVGVGAAVLAYRMAPPDTEPIPPEQAAWSAEPEPEEGEVPPGQPAEWPVVAVIPTDDRTEW